MNDNHLSTYLSDHLAGAVAGIKLAEDCREHNPSGPLHDALTELLLQIKEDYEVLKDVQVARTWCGVLSEADSDVVDQQAEQAEAW